MLRYLPRSEVYHLSIYTEKEVRLPHNFDFLYKYLHPLPRPFVQRHCGMGRCLNIICSHRVFHDQEHLTPWYSLFIKFSMEIKYFS